MWIPKCAEELEAAARRGDIIESSRCEAKRELQTKGDDLAVCISSMSVLGGVVIYGLAEDEHGCLRVPAPMSGLSAARDRIDQTVQHSVSGTLTIDIQMLPCSDDPDVGYLVVHVPLSLDAPHQILVRGHHRGRYYGRGEIGKRVLDHAEIEQLFSRRETHRRSLDQQLQRIRERRPIELIDGVITILLRTAVDDTKLLRRALNGMRAGESELATLRELMQGVCVRSPSKWEPDFNDLYTWRTSPRGGYRGVDIETDDGAVVPPRYLEVVIGGDLSVEIVCGRGLVGARPPNQWECINEELAGSLIVQGLTLCGLLSQEAALDGPIDVVVEIDGINGAGSGLSSGWIGRIAPYPEDTYRQQLRTSTFDAIGAPRDVAQALLDDLLRVTTGRSDIELFAAE